MRTAEELESMQSHPTAVQDASGTPDHEVEDPYRAHFDAIEELKDVVLLHGPQSFEAGYARRQVERTRESAIAAWRQERTAA